VRLQTPCQGAHLHLCGRHRLLHRRVRLEPGQSLRTPTATYLGIERVDGHSMTAFPKREIFWKSSRWKPSQNVGVLAFVADATRDNLFQGHLKPFPDAPRLMKTVIQVRIRGEEMVTENA
jgi:hypothetical protein